VNTNKNIPDYCVLTIGKFEGIHLGHRALLGEATRQARRLNIASAAIIFEPHPYIFLKDANYKPLFTNAERSHLLKDIYIDNFFYCPFDENFAAMSPVNFCELLFEKYKAKLVIVGENYRFGKDRAGDIPLLQAQGEKYHANVQVFPTHRVLIWENSAQTPESQPELQSSPAKGNCVSTSNIRKLLSENNLSEAARQLGFLFFVMGEVKKGKQLGRTIGFPTLNIYPPEEKFLPPDGVYASQATINGVLYRGVTNIGLRPTVNSESKIRSVETHLLDYNSHELYGENVKVELLKFIRPERRFNSLEELKAQIAKDIN
jgi:riboflavin kinase/FMN adenylyltransferase